MLNRFSQFAQHLSWAYPLFLVIGTASLLFSLWVIVLSPTSAEEAGFIPAVLLFSWCFLLLCFLNLFRFVPPSPTPQDKFGRRLMLRLHRATLIVIALGFSALTLAMLVVSYKLLAIWLLN
ncbi:MAG: hypothetical protein WD772_01550 [Pseudohongiellaceae bacterium]